MEGFISLKPPCAIIHDAHMTSSVSSPSAPHSFAERIAWLHEPVQLSGLHLPWFVVRMLEHALHGYLCSLEQVLLTLWELYQQGKLPPLAETPEAADRPRPPKYKMKFPPATPTRGAGCAAVPQVPKTADAAPPEAAKPAACWAAVRLALVRGKPQFSAPADRSTRRQTPRLGGGAWMRPHRCRRSMFLQPAAALRENCA